MFDQPRTKALPILRTQPVEHPSDRTVPEMLLDLLKGLAGLETSRSMVRGRRSVRRYRDAEFNYIEAAAPELDGVEADICIHDGRIFVRVAR